MPLDLANPLTANSAAADNGLPLLLDADELARILAVSVATLHRMKSSGRLGPRPIRLSRGCVRWRRCDIEKWIADGCPNFDRWKAICPELK